MNLFIVFYVNIGYNGKRLKVIVEKIEKRYEITFNEIY